MLALFLTGCTGGAATSETREQGPRGHEQWDHEPKIGNVPKFDEIAGKDYVETPLDTYRITMNQYDVIRRAERRLEVECLREFGFDPPGPWQSASSLPGYLGGSSAGNYGITRMEEARKYGYKNPPGKIADPQEERAKLGLKDPTEEEVAISQGDIQGTYNGVKVPEGGCLGKARRLIGLDDFSPFADGPDSLVTRLTREASTRAEEDSRVRKAFSNWSICMADKGYDYPNPWAANDNPKWQESNTASQEEISTAVADVECRREGNLVGIWHATKVAYQEELIERNAEQLAEEKPKNEALVRKANEVVGR